MSVVGHQRVRFGNCDPAGIAYYPRLIEMIDIAVEDWTATGTGVSRRAMHVERGLGLPTAAIEVTFALPCRLDDLLAFDIAVAAVGTTSVRLEVQATCNGARRFAAVLTQVLIELTTGQPVAWPPEWRKRLESLRTRELAA